MIYLELIWSFFQIGLFSIGGGYAAIPLIKHQIVELHGWLTLTEFTDIITISQMTPGPIAINSATFAGTQIAGFAGSIAATLGCITPSCIIVIILSKLYYKYRELNAMQYVLSGLRPAVVSLIASASLSLVLFAFFTGGLLPSSVNDIDFISIAIFALAIFILRKWKINPIYVICVAGAAGLIAYSLV